MAAAHLRSTRFFVSGLVLFGVSHVVVLAFREGQMCFYGVVGSGPVAPAHAVKKQEFSEAHLRRKEKSPRTVKHPNGMFSRELQDVVRV